MESRSAVAPEPISLRALEQRSRNQKRIGKPRMNIPARSGALRYTNGESIPSAFEKTPYEERPISKAQV